MWMETDALMAAARQNDANTADALAAAQQAVQSLVALKGTGMFGVSPAGETTGAVFGQASSVIDELITEVNQAITVLNQNLHASVDAVVQSQEVATVDYTKMTRDNATRVKKLGTTGLKPGDPNYVPPTSEALTGNGSATHAGGATGTSASDGTAAPTDASSVND